MNFKMCTEVSALALASINYHVGEVFTISALELAQLTF